MPESAQFSQLVQQFAADLQQNPSRAAASQHRLALLRQGQEQAAQNFQAVQALAAQNADIAPAVFQGLLPHADTPANRARGVWIHPAPAVGGELRRWQRHASNAPAGWQASAAAIWSFIRRCVEQPEQLADACATFARDPAAVGFQTATLSSILSALCPQDFHFVNGATARVIQHFSGQPCSTRIADYPQANRAVQQFLHAHAGDLQLLEMPDVPPADLFESFCHWLVSQRRYAFPTTRYWSLRPEDGDEWRAWQEGGFVALSQPQLEDLSRLSRQEFDRLRTRLAENGQASKRALDRLWRFAHRVQEGDGVLVEMDGAVLGVGTAVGQYYYVSEEAAGHCLPVAWDDLQPRAAPGRAHLGLAFRELDRATFARLAAGEPLPGQKPDGQMPDDSPPADAPPHPDTDPPPALRESRPVYAPLHSAPADAPTDSPHQTSPPVSLAEIAQQTGFAQERLAQWRAAIQRKGQAIFYGPPGTGKTHIALELARHLTGGGDGFYEVVQFHPSYAYEEFVQGLRPHTQAGQLHYRLTPGRFLRFCQAAAQRSDLCVLVIDEINRADIARIFGELLHGLEYRGRPLPLAGGGSLCVPPNVLLIGTMNTADRSIALLDYALRRRFAFLHLPPEYDVLRHFFQRNPSTSSETGQQTGAAVEPLIALLRRINRAIDDPNYALGITFFLRPDLGQELEAIWRTEIEPYLEEYFFDRPAQVEPFHWERVAGGLAL